MNVLIHILVLNSVRIYFKISPPKKWNVVFLFPKAQFAKPSAALTSADEACACLLMGLLTSLQVEETLRKDFFAGGRGGKKQE